MKFLMYGSIGVVLAGCTSSKCSNESGCDTAAAEEETEEETGPVSASVGWEGASLVVEISGLGEGTFGLAETAGDGEGWYLEDCISSDAVFCHTVRDGTNAFVSIHKSVTGADWDGAMDNNETMMRPESATRITWALFDAGGSCVAVGGHDTEYYASSGCVNL